IGLGGEPDVFAIALHQAGHALGLGHSADPADVMYPYYGQSQRISGGDMAALRALQGERQSGRPLKKSQTPDMKVARSHSGVLQPGQMGATSLLPASNTGSGASSGVITVAERAPAGLTATSLTGIGWSCLQPAGPCTRSDSLPAGSSYAAITVGVNVA